MSKLDEKIKQQKTLNKRYGRLIRDTIEWILHVLSNLRSDLQLRLEEQQKTLEQAKSEVEQNIHGTIELEQISELQQARLDKQIEQFEELQRVLVKVQ
ncbi:MAG: hypothetical protein PHY14_03375 [Candidatus Gracilibacteria bacterium]|nr:hypothetical protein [Candidatus Gracilibacteria bacterium]